MNIIRKIKDLWIRRNSGSYISFLRRRGVKIGDGTVIFYPHNIQIDISRPELLEIGNHVFLHKNMVIMTHDWAGWCFVESHKEFIPSHGKVTIGNNVWFGENVTICKNVTIGNNCIIGIGSIVTKSIPDNSVAAGVPAKVICSYDEFFEKRRKKYVEEAIEYAKEIIKNGRAPQVSDFFDDYPCFVDGENYLNYNYSYNDIFTEEQFEFWKKHHKKMFNGFDAFIEYVRKDIKENKR